MIVYTYVICKPVLVGMEYREEYYQDPILAPPGVGEFHTNKTTAMVFTAVNAAVRIADILPRPAYVRVLTGKEQSQFGGASESPGTASSDQTTGRT